MALPVRVERGYANDPREITRQDMNQLLGSFFGRSFLNEFGDGGTLGSFANYGVDIREDAHNIYVEADLPGFRKEDVDISLQDDVLTISAERHEERDDKPEGGKEGQQQAASGNSGRREEYLLHERRVQRFVRSFTLPPNVDPQSVQAKMQNGVLQVALRKREESNRKRIQVS